MRVNRARIGAALALWAAVSGLGEAPAATDETPVIRITAKKFEYDRREIVLRKGVPVVLEVTSVDRLHGLNLPDFGVRVDAVPGQVTRLRFTPDKAGKFVFICDVFCGDGHETMGGNLVVKE
jgi:cytochrome c oxidase subunit 2